ncbi:hypothetical protein BO71DRAFT_179540 [Aspergillus ellipticus CBS 707.79]|uniref:Uncharacterized protein n=1 Tax=Aspergillus ellipticus CBS 707.79 TaxID=1448320 RepID=A0A319CQB1_9EURO|nr:hypothetical protein BO71DRAFT_179540 [Aspergillus ellipticus CBS 707.79]
MCPTGSFSLVDRLILRPFLWCWGLGGVWTWDQQQTLFQTVDAIGLQVLLQSILLCASFMNLPGTVISPQTQTQLSSKNTPAT